MIHIRTNLYPVVNKNPYHALHPRKSKLKKDVTLIPTLSFTKYLKGLVLVITDGDAAQKAMVICRMGYAHEYEGHILWEEALNIINTHVSDATTVS